MPTTPVGQSLWSQIRQRLFGNHPPTLPHVPMVDRMHLPGDYTPRAGTPGLPAGFDRTWLRPYSPHMQGQMVVESSPGVFSLLGGGRYSSSPHHGPAAAAPSLAGGTYLGGRPNYGNDDFYVTPDGHVYKVYRGNFGNLNPALPVTAGVGAAGGGNTAPAPQAVGSTAGTPPHPTSYATEPAPGVPVGPDTPNVFVQGPGPGGPFINYPGGVAVPDAQPNPGNAYMDPNTGQLVPYAPLGSHSVAGGMPAAGPPGITTTAPAAPVDAHTAILSALAGAPPADEYNVDPRMGGVYR